MKQLSALLFGRAITTLNEPSQHSALFTGDGRAYSEFERLRRANPLAFRIVGPAADPVSMARTDHPTVTISREPWGEATINLPGRASRSSIAFIQRAQPEPTSPVAPTMSSVDLRMFRPSSAHILWMP